MAELSPHEELLGQKSRDGERRLGEPDALLLDRRAAAVLPGAAAQEGRALQHASLHSCKEDTS